MKQGKLFTVLAAAVLGISAAGFPAAPEAPAGIVAEAADRQYITSGSFRFSYIPGNPNARLEKYLGSSTSVSIPSSISTSNGQKTVKAIGEKAFVNVVPHQPLEGMTVYSVSIPDTVTAIGLYAFYGTPLTSLSLPSGLLSISGSAFEHCTQLTSVTVPSGVRTIQADTFRECYRLRQVVLAGATTIKSCAFYDCTDLRSIRMPNNCKTSGTGVFENCASLDLVNGQIPWNKSAFNNSGAAPVLSSDSNIRKLLKNCFSRSENIRFLVEYCSALCTYIVQTETRPWMSEAVKARVLHDWLINHCDYEDENSGESIDDLENHVSSSVFLSYGLNIRGNGIGETVCAGYAKAYRMLLETAGIESYCVGDEIPDGPHQWNIVKVEGKYYQCDVTWDDNGTGNPIGYQHFLKTNAKMKELHRATSNPTVRYHTEHPLLVDWYHNGSYALQNCTNTFSDADGDGLLDYDLNFDGSYDIYDLYVSYMLNNMDINLDGQVNEQDNYLAQLYNFLFGGAPLTHEIWLQFCIYTNIPG